MTKLIKDAWKEINDNKELCNKVCMSVASRLQKCVNVDGKIFEYLRDIN